MFSPIHVRLLYVNKRRNNNNNNNYYYYYAMATVLTLHLIQRTDLIIVYAKGKVNIACNGIITINL